MPQTYIDFAFVKENASFERVLEHYNLTIRGTGSQRSIACPFHPDKRPSCRVEVDRKIFNCFACQASGNILEFVARMEGDADDLQAAALKLADICSIAPAALRGTPGAKSRQAAQHSRKGAERPQPQPEAQTPSPAPPVASEGMVNPPLTFGLKLDATHPYLAERSVSAETIATFGLGYCSRGVMAGRVCIPIHNATGELVAYAGRWPGEPPEGVERYLLPSRFEKSRVLFNLHRVSDVEHVVLVEGYWSVFRLHALGMPVAALMGSSVSEAQLAVLRERGTRRVTLLLDGDDAGGAA
ncbi:MAG: CHC2 zinc finger domain-containing protein, partial [Thiohalocapsa sp.]